MKGKSKRPKQRPQPARLEIHIEDLKAIVERAKVGALSAEECEKLGAAVDTLGVVTRELETQGATIRQLRKLLFGSSTETTSNVVGRKGTEEEAGTSEGAATTVSPAAEPDASKSTGGAGQSGEPRPKRRGHGRNGASSYRGADKETVAHGTLRPGDRCPECQRGKVYVQQVPKVLVRVRGMAPLVATVYELERLRCNLCGKVFTAAEPDGVGEEKYDETAAAMIGLLKYGTGMPFTRLERLEGDLGIPLPATTQWEVVDGAADLVEPAADELIRQAAQGEVVHNDDTTMKILDIAPPEPEPGEKKREGTFTTGIVSVGSGHRIALFFTGRDHAGENLAEVLRRRAAELSAPIQMSDALSRNRPGDFETIVGHCLVHARRRYVKVADDFPEEVRHVLETLREVYQLEAETRERGMSDEARLSFHKERSAPLMKGLEEWMAEQLDERKVEPNSGLGEAIKHMQTHWERLTLFLRVAGAPLDNNICERALKKAILHRKNAYFFKTEHGAHVGDVFMSLIHTCELEGVDPFDYLVALQRHHESVKQNPGEWMPWNYEQALAKRRAESTPAS